MEAGLTVAVTGPTGEIGKPFVTALERCPQVERIIGMARSPFDPLEEGWTKTMYLQGDVLDRDAVEQLVADTDVVVHLAFIIMTSSEASREVNLTGSRNVFEAAVAAGVKRLVYTSSVAAYGYHDDNPPLLSEEDPTRGTEGHAYSAHKAEVEKVLAEVTADSPIELYMFRPSIVAGPQAPMLIEHLPYTQLSDRLPGGVQRLLDGVPILKPVIPDSGVPFQLVHHDDVAAALCAAVLGEGHPGVYNLAAEGTLTIKSLADELGWYSIPVPELAVDAFGELITRLPFLPAEAQWINAMRAPVVVDTTKAQRELGWHPEHTAIETLRSTILASREEPLLR